MKNLIMGVTRQAIAAGLVAAMATGAWAQEAPPTGGDATPDADVTPAANNAMIAFNFENAPWEQVINYFSRAAGVPVIREADVPGGALTFLSPESYDLNEALRVLNTILRTKGMYLRRDQEFLYLGKLAEMPSRDVETFADGEIPEDITEDQIITIVIPLENLVAEPISKQLAPLVASYGKLLPLPEQNALVLTETAAQCRRLQKIISTLDSEVPPANQTELFKLKHAKAEEAVQALRVLSQEQRTTFVIGPNGKRVKVDESKLEGLRIEADKRTNSIIVVGPGARIEMIRELVTMIDVPEPSMSREMATFSLRTITPTEGVAHLTKLFAKLGAENQPTVLPLEESGKLTIVGTSQAIVEASALLREIDGGGEPIDMSAVESEPRVAVIPLEHSDPAGAMRVLKMLLNPRQQRTVKMSPTPDNAALVVSAMASDIEAVRSLLTAVDVERPVDREVRIVRIDRGEPMAVLGRTQELYALQADLSQAANRIEATLDEAARSVTLVGSRRAIDQFARTLAEAQRAITPNRESRTFTITNTEPSRIVRALTGLTNQLLQPTDGRTLEAPQFEAVDELDALLVRATADQFETIETLIGRLDTVQPGDRDYRVIPMAGSDPKPLLRKTEELYAARTQGFDQRVYGTLSTNLDEATGAVTLAGAREAIDYYLRMMDNARKLLPPDRTMELVDLRNVRAAELLPQLQSLLEVTPPIDPGRTVPAPEFRVVEQTNDLVVIAEAAQHRLIRDYIRRLDVVDPNRATFRIVPLTQSGGAELIQRTNALYGTQTAGLDPGIYAGLTAELDDVSGNIVLTGSNQAIREWTTLLTQARQLAAPARSTILIDLREAKAAEVIVPLQEFLATADSIDPSRKIEPPTITAMERTNSLIVYAEPAQHALVRDFVRKLDVLDRGELPPLRLLQVRAADAQAIARMLMDQYDRRSQEDRREKPVDIRADGPTNTLIVSAHEDLFEEIRAFVEDINTEGTEEADRVTEIYPLKVARAEDLARAMDQLYPTPPIPRDRRGAPMPWLAKPKEVNVSADPASNSLIVDAPASRIPAFKALVEKLDRVELPPAAQLKTYRVVDADPAYVARTLQNLSRQGTLSLPPQPGQKQVQVTIDHEPRSSTLIVAGDEYTFQQVETILEELQAAPVDREVRIVTVSRGDPETVLDKASTLYEVQTDTARKTNQVAATLDPVARTVTLIGARQAVDRFARTLREVEQGVVIDRELRTYKLTHAEPSKVVRALSSLAQQLLKPADGRAFEAPQIDAVDQLDSLLVRATEEQFAVLDGLVETLDAPQAGDRQFRIVPIEGLEPGPLVERTQALYTQQTAGLDPDVYEDLAVEIDTASGNVLLTGSGDAIRQWTDLLTQVRQLVPPQRTTAIIDLREARAEDVVVPLEELLATADSIDPSREVPPPTIRVVERTNSLLVTGEAAQQAMVRDYVRKLDVLEPGDLPPLRLLQVRAADAQAIARMLMDQYDRRSQEDRREKPVTVKADAPTNTLIVSAHEDLYEEIRTFIEGLNEEASEEADRVTEIYPLKVARAEDLARAMDQLYPTPPIPRDRRGAPMPWLAKPKEVNVSADPGSNSLIVDAPASRIPAFKALVEKLDVVELPPATELRTYRVARADPAAVSRTMENLAREGKLSAPPQPGKKPVQVTVDFEPLSKTLIVAGDSYTFDRVETILQDLQAVPIERELRVIPLIGAKPEDIRTQAMAIYESQTAEIPDAGEVDVTIEQRSNSLMVVADDEAMARFLSIVDELQETLGPPRDVQLYELQHAQATEVVAFLTDLIESSAPFRSSATGPDPVIEPIEANNSLLIAADEIQHAIIGSLIDSMDVMNVDDMPPLRILQLRTADASNLARALTDTYNQRTPEQRAQRPVNIRADVNSNTLLVSAHPEVYEEIKQIVADMNIAGGISREGREIRIFPLKFAKAEELAQTIDEMYPEPPVPLDRRGNPIYAAQQPREVRVRADRFTNSIIVDAPVQRMAGFEQLVESLDKRDIPDDIELHTYTIVSADLPTVAETLRRLAQNGSLTRNAPAGALSSPITVETEPVSRTLIVSGPAEIFAEVEKLLTELDAQPDAPTMVMRFYKLKHARADQLEAMLDQLLAAQLRETLIKEGKAAGQIEALLEVTADPRSNTLIIRSPEWLAPVADQLIEQLDDPIAAAGRPVIRIIALTFADAADVARSLTQSLPAIELPSGDPVRVLAVPGSNAIILTGAEKDLGQVEEMVATLDARPALDAIDVKTYPLQYADAEEIADVVERLLVDQQANDPQVLLYLARFNRGQIPDRPMVQVEADARTNSLIVSAQAQTIALATAIIEQLDTAPELATRDIALYTPRRGSPAQLARTVSNVMAETSEEVRRERVQIMADDGSTAVLIIGDEDQIAQAKELLEEFDGLAAAPPVMDLQLVDLKHADASTVALTLTPMLIDQNRWPPDLQELLRAGIRVARPSISADADANRVLISAPSSLMEVARSLIKALDAPPSVSDGPMEVRVFALKSGSADSVARTIQTAMDARRRTVADRRVPAPVVVPEAASNSIVVTATSKQMEQVQQLLVPLDVSIDPEQPQVRTVYLKHARAEQIAPIVEQLLAPERVDMWIRYQAMSRGRPLETGPDVRIAAEPRLNAIVVTAPVAVLDVAEEMVVQLDVDRSQLGDERTRTVRVLHFENADAAALAQNLEAVFTDVEGDEPVPVIRVDEASNSLIVRATQEQFDTIEQIAGELDRATLTSQREMRTIFVDPSRASADDLARTLQRLLRQRSGEAVEVITIEQLMQRQLEDAEEVGLAPFRTFRGLDLTSGLASLVFAQTAGDELEEDLKEERTGTVREEAAITIAVDPATNSLIVVGSPRMTERLAQLATELERELPADPGRVRVIPLPRLADARQVAQLVTGTIRQIGQRSPDNPGGFTARAAVLADPAGGAIIVSANDTDFDRIGELIVALAAPTEADETVVRIYPLSTIAADQAAARVNELFTTRRGRQARAVRAEFMELEGERVMVEPGAVRAVANRVGEQLIVTAPAEAMPLIDRFVAVIDQASSAERASIRQIELDYADANLMARNLQAIFDARRAGRAAQEPVRARFVADPRTNTLLVTASEEQFSDLTTLLAELDSESDDVRYPLTVVSVQTALPSRVVQVAQQVIFDRDPGRRAKISIVPDDESGLILVRAPEDDVEVLQDLAEKLDQTPGRNVPIRTIVIENGDALRIAASVNQFFSQREQIARQGNRRRSSGSKVAVVGDRRTNSLIVAAADEDYAEIEGLVKTLDAEGGVGEMQFAIYPLEHARASDLQGTIAEMLDELGWRSMWGDRADSGEIIVRTDERLNAIIVIGQGDNFRLAERLIKMVDIPEPEGAGLAIKVTRIENADIRVVQQAVQNALGGTQYPSWYWRQQSADELKISIDTQSRVMVFTGAPNEVEEAVELAMQLDEAAARPDQSIEMLNLEYASAADVGRSLQQFFRDRARREGLRDSNITIAGSVSGNTVIVSATEEDLLLVRDLVSQMDQPDSGEDRTIEVYALDYGEAGDVARAVTQMFPRSRGSREKDVIITADRRTNALIVSAPKDRFTEVDALIKRLDTAPSDEVMMLRTYTLSSSRASDVARVLEDALDLDEPARGRSGDLRPILVDEQGNPIRVKATITPDTRSNTLIISATPESFELLEKMISELDEQPYVNPREYRVFELKHVIASDLSLTLRSLIGRRGYGDDPVPTITYSGRDNTLIVYATADQISEITEILAELDKASETPRLTEFVPLKFADAEQVREALGVFYGRWALEAVTPGAQNTSIVADPATNSLVISSVEDEWPRIRELIAQLDSEEYDTSRQLRVIALRFADASSVAQAINQAFEIQVQRQRDRQNADRRRGNQDEPDAPTVLVASEEIVRVSAEPRSNAIIVSAARREMERVEAIVKTLDVADYANLPAPKIIALSTAKADRIVPALQQMYQQQQGGRRGVGARGVVIVADRASNSIIVRAEEEQYIEIRALALALEETASSADVSIRVVQLERVRATRARTVLQQALQTKARQSGEPLSIEVDRLANSLVIATTASMFAQIEPVLEEIDSLGAALGDGEEGVLPGGRGVYVVPIENVTPDEMKRLLESMGLNRPPRGDELSIVTEPIQISTLSTLRSLIITASPQDKTTVLRLVAQLDQSPAHADQDLAIIPLQTATATNVVRTLEQMLSPSNQSIGAAPAQAIKEQIRRLNLRRNGLDVEDLTVDLSQPIQIFEDRQTNAVIISASAANIAALREIVTMLDTLPIGDQVTVTIFHLNNADAGQLEGVIRRLFREGAAASQAIGTTRRTLPPTTTGEALVGEIGMSVDQRTNALIIAAREEAIALVEVLIEELDSDEAARWVEPRVLPLRYADATDLAETLDEILVQGQRNLPQATSIQRQVSRLRVTREGGDPITTDVFVPLSRLIIRPDENLNALIVVGTTVNVEAVSELVAMMDTEAASPNASVRIYPLENGDAERVARTVEDFFRDQLRSGTIREDDAVQIAVDVRTNALIVSTSPRSFSVFENLLTTLDAASPNPMVDVHVLRVDGMDVDRLAPRIEQIMRDRRAAQGSSATDADRVSIEPDAGSNSLIVAANADNLATVQRIIELLTQAESATADAGGVYRVMPLSSARADDIVPALEDLYVDEVNRDRGQGTLSVTADDRLNAVLISGSEADIREVEKLVTMLDQAPTHSVKEIRIIELKAANALEMESLLQLVLSGRGLAGSRFGTRQATMLRFIEEKRLEEETGQVVNEAQITAAIQEQISITPDVRTNSLIVSAPKESLQLIEAIVEELDSSKGGDRRIEIFELVNADAEQMAELLAELFSLRQQGRVYILTPRIGVPGTTGPDPDDEDLLAGPDEGLGGTELTAVPDERQQLSITVDPRTNSLLVSGTPRYMELVEDVILELDSKVANERDTEVIRLRNAKAIEVAQVMDQFVSQEQDRILRLLGPERSGSLTRRLEQEISIVGDQVSNTVLLSASPRYIDKVRSIIAELDEPPPQVMIQVVLAEVTIDSDTQWGMDISAGPFGGEEARASSTFGLSGAAIAATALGVPNLSVSTTDFSLLIRALESQGRLEVLSRPQIVAANNEAARLQVGERVSLPTDVRVNDNGSVNSTIEQEDLGIILDVTPSVNDDGFVRLEVKPVFSNLTTRTTQVSEDFEAPVISVREIETVVTVKDGQTVVIGGLIENRVERRKAKVPLLGDIPILGIPFQAELTQRNRTELLVLLTPRVLRQPESADEVTRIELDRMGMPAERRDILRRGDFVDDIPIDVDLDDQFRDHEGNDEDEVESTDDGSDDGVTVRPAQIYGVK